MTLFVDIIDDLILFVDIIDDLILFVDIIFDDLILFVDIIGYLILFNDLSFSVKGNLAIYSSIHFAMLWSSLPSKRGWNCFNMLPYF